MRDDDQWPKKVARRNIIDRIETCDETRRKCCTTDDHYDCIRHHSLYMQYLQYFIVIKKDKNFAIRK